MKGSKTSSVRFLRGLDFKKLKSYQHHRACIHYLSTLDEEHEIKEPPEMFNIKDFPSAIIFTDLTVILCTCIVVTNARKLQKGIVKLILA